MIGWFVEGWVEVIYRVRWRVVRMVLWRVLVEGWVEVIYRVRWRGDRMVCGGLGGGYIQS